MRIKHIIFDLDGVLVDIKDIHFKALNEAISLVDPKYIIDYNEHITIYDGLNTKEKLNLLYKNKNLPIDKFDYIFDKKQEFTQKYLEQLQCNEQVCNILSNLKERGYTISVATNSVKKTTELVLNKCCYDKYIDFAITNEDVNYKKPNTEIYLKSMIKANVSPRETLIIEDSYVGRTGAFNSGAYVFGINSSKDLIYSYILDKISECNMINKNLSYKWEDRKLNVLIPMAGDGSRFFKAGYKLPKPIIKVFNKPMISWVLDNLGYDANYTFIIRKEHYDNFNEFKEFFNNLNLKYKIIFVDKLTEGAACTTLLVKEYINNENPLIMANCDQFVEWNEGFDNNNFIYSCINGIYDASILIFNSNELKWSYVKLNDNNEVIEVAEKKPISNIATVGIYFWKHGSDYVKYAEQMISKNIRVNNEFYVCPVFNEALLDNKKISIYPVKKMWGLGTPEDLDYFIKNYGKVCS